MVARDLSRSVRRWARAFRAVYYRSSLGCCCRFFIHFIKYFYEENNIFVGINADWLSTWSGKISRIFIVYSTDGLAIKTKLLAMIHLCFRVEMFTSINVTFRIQTNFEIIVFSPQLTERCHNYRDRWSVKVRTDQYWSIISLPGGPIAWGQALYNMTLRCVFAVN